MDKIKIVFESPSATLASPLKRNSLIPAHATTAFWLTAHIVCFSSGAVAIKMASVSVAILQLIFFRSLIALAASSLTKASRAQILLSLRSKVLKVLLLRATTGFLGIYGTFYAISVLPTPIAMALTGITPIFVILLEALLLKEKIKKEIYIYVLLTMAGIYVSTNKGAITATQNISIMNVAIGLTSGALVAVSFVSVRVAVQKVGVSAVMFWFGLGNLAGSLIFGGTTLFSTDFSHRETIYITLICLLGAASDFSKTAAYKSAHAWIVSLLSLLAIPASGILAFLLLDERLTTMQWAGISLMLVSLAASINRRN